MNDLGFDAAALDWNEAFAGRPMNERDWSTLTLGEQRRYAQRECQTKGAIYKSKVSADRIEFSVSLPASLALNSLTKAEAEKIERWLHRAVEREIVSILQLRQLGGGMLP